MKKLSSTLSNMLLSLTGICLVVSGVLALLNHLTQAPIAAAKVAAKIEAIKVVVPDFDNNPYEAKTALLLEGDRDSIAVYPAYRGDTLVGYAIESYTNEGFSGYISIMVGIDAAGHLVDYSVLETSETPGLGTKIQEWFRTPSTKGLVQDVRGLDLKARSPLKVSKDGGEVDAITAATISSRAFLDALTRAHCAYDVMQSGQVATGEGSNH